MKSIALIVMVSVVLEALVEYAKTIGKLVEEGEHKTAITQGITVLLGIGLSFAFGTHLFNGCLAEVYSGLHINDSLDLVLTGILFSRGSNYFSDFVGKLTNRSGNDAVAHLMALAEDGVAYQESDLYDDFEDDDEEDEYYGIIDDLEAEETL